MMGEKNEEKAKLYIDGEEACWPENINELPELTASNAEQGDSEAEHFKTCGEFSFRLMPEQKKLTKKRFIKLLMGRMGYPRDRANTIAELVVGYNISGFQWAYTKVYQSILKTWLFCGGYYDGKKTAYYHEIAKEMGEN